MEVEDVDDNSVSEETDSG